jgi:UDP-N-acetyl-alpha-D-muramoyl-L-alanyl-L-glutamate epimerase
MKDSRDLYAALRAQHPRLIYERFTIEEQPSTLLLSYYFLLEPNLRFNPTLTIPRPLSPLPSPFLRHLVFHLGLIELISYWKAACSPTILILAGELHPAQIEWWREVYYHGLGEFFYLNGLTPALDTFLQIESLGESYAPHDSLAHLVGKLIPVGGGKDSLVTLDLLQSERATNRPFLLNPTRAQWQSTAVMDYAPEQVLVAHRKIDPRLIELNHQGYLNGHTPFSALLGFLAVLVAALHRLPEVVLSNEASADESTVQGSEINHQWSKSHRFEQMFRAYVHRWLTPQITYSSLLRTWNELEITRRLVQNKKALAVFRSCNVGQKTDSWCGQCPKCLFVNIMLAPWLDRAEIRQILGGHEPLDNPSLRGTFHQLIGTAPTKPFECVGTIAEVRTALTLAAKKDGPPHLLRMFMKEKQI